MSRIHRSSAATTARVYPSVTLKRSDRLSCLASKISGLFTAPKLLNGLIAGSMAFTVTLGINYFTESSDRKFCRLNDHLVESKKVIETLAQDSKKLKSTLPSGKITFYQTSDCQEVSHSSDLELKEFCKQNNANEKAQSAYKAAVDQTKALSARNDELSNKFSDFRDRNKISCDPSLLNDQENSQRFNFTAFSCVILTPLIFKMKSAVNHLFPKRISDEIQPLPILAGTITGIVLGVWTNSPLVSFSAGSLTAALLS